MFADIALDVRTRRRPFGKRW